jgi:hypothetical protein
MAVGSVFMSDPRRTTILRKKRSRFSLSLVEVIIASVILVLLASTMTYGFMQFYRETRIKNGKKELEILLRQADYLSTVLRQEIRVDVLQHDDEWLVFLQTWGADTSGLHFTRMLRLPGVSSIEINGRSFSEANISFIGVNGIIPSCCEIYEDSGHKSRSLQRGEGPKKKDIILTIKGQKSSYSFNLRAYMSDFAHESIPKEFVDQCAD